VYQNTPSTTAKTTITDEKQSYSSLQKSLTISDSAIQGPSKTFNAKGLLVVFIFISYQSSFFPHRSCFWFPLVFVGFEENVRKHSSSDLSRFNHIYNLKTQLSARFCQKVSMKRKLVAKLSDESQNLKHDLNKAQASNLELEK
jgi:hypothetical protein